MSLNKETTRSTGEARSITNCRVLSRIDSLNLQRNRGIIYNACENFFGLESRNSCLCCVRRLIHISDVYRRWIAILCCNCLEDLYFDSCCLTSKYDILNRGQIRRKRIRRVKFDKVIEVINLDATRLNRRTINKKVRSKPGDFRLDNSLELCKFSCLKGTTAIKQDAIVVIAVSVIVFISRSKNLFGIRLGHLSTLEMRLISQSIEPDKIIRFRFLLRKKLYATVNVRT